MSYRLVNNEEAKQYEFHIDGKMARVEYILAKDRIFLTHTEVSKSLWGKGVGASIVLAVLQDIKARGLTLVPLCPFVAVYIKKHPEWMSLVLKGVKIE